MALDPGDENAVEALCGAPWPTLQAVCGLTVEWTMPGMFSRLGMERCTRCCDYLSVEPGCGTPANGG